MKELIDVEKCIIALEKKASLEDRKYKKVSFKDNSRKKMVKDPYDMEAKVLLVVRKQNLLIQTHQLQLPVLIHYRSRNLIET